MVFFIACIFANFSSRVPSDPFIAITRSGISVNSNLRSYSPPFFLFNLHCFSVTGDSQNVLASGHDFTGSLSFFNACRYGVLGQNLFFTLDIDISTTFFVSCGCGFPLSIQSIYDPGLLLALDLNK